MSDQCIDEVDYAILSCVGEYDAVWKKRVHDLVSDRCPEFPHMDAVSVQTVGRRINKLQENGLLESCILSPDELNRDLIIGYNLTEDGERAVREKRERFLKNELLYLSEQAVIGNQPLDTDITREAYIKLIADEFGISESVRDSVLEKCGTIEISALLGGYFLLRDIPKLLDPGALPRLAQIVEAAPKMRDVFTGNPLVEQLSAVAESGPADITVKEIESMQA